MKVYIMRHAEAGYSATSDSSRPLTPLGKQQCVAVALWFKQQNISFDLAMVSPYLRTQQTLTILNQEISINKVETSQLLTPNCSADNLVDNLTILPLMGISSVLLVSHLPLVGYLVNELCPSIAPPMFSPADVACITISSDGQGKLEWIHHPK